jgi:DNA-binding transcriptional ArsR family regulator
MSEVLNAELLRDLGQTTRLKIVESLMEGEKNVSELQEIIGDIQQGRLSTHLT